MQVLGRNDRAIDNYRQRRDVASAIILPTNRVSRCAKKSLKKKKERAASSRLELLSFTRIDRVRTARVKTFTTAARRSFVASFVVSICPLFLVYSVYHERLNDQELLPLTNNVYRASYVCPTLSILGRKNAFFLESVAVVMSHDTKRFLGTRWVRLCRTVNPAR